MRGNVEVNGIEMTPAQLVELYLETRNNLEEMQRLYEKKRKEVDELETELRVKEDLLTIKGAISNEPAEAVSARPSIEWYECEMMKGLEEISRQKAIINNLVETIYLLQMK